MDDNLRDVINQFQIDGCFVEGMPYGSGHLHETYRVQCEVAEGYIAYLLQKINTGVFRNVSGMMANIQKVTEHIRQTLQQNGIDQVSRRVLSLVPTHNGQTYWHDARGQAWRLYHFIEKSQSLEVAGSCEQIEQAAFAFGRFLAHLQDFPVSQLQETIPHFHHGPRRHLAFTEAVKKDPHCRVTQAQTEIDFVDRHVQILESIQNLVERDLLPQRVVHNDTKLNNVLLDEHTGASLCVIDLDTVMPGLALYDFGDMVRTMVSDVPEDESDLSKVDIGLDRFAAIVRGFLKGAEGVLTPAEVDSLILGATFMPMIIGTRFLTDFLQGDVYYSTQHSQHNLQRCRVQFKLVELLLKQEQDLTTCIRRYAS